MLFLLPPFLIVLFSRGAVSMDYCDKDLCLPQITHIACRNYGDFDESCGSGAVIMQFPMNLRAQLLNVLNDFRNTVALGKHSSFRPAARMATLRWHKELAGLAKFALRRCENMDDFCSNTHEFKYVSYIYGSSRWLHREKTPRSIVEFVLKYWMDDMKACTMAHINAERPPKDGQCRGYFTQLVQDLAAHVGCAMMMRRSHSDGLYQYGLLCQFSRGKIANELVYRESSHPGSRCYAGTHSTYQGLCSPEEHVNPNALQLGALN
ncbi:antigen 5 like allergen Cul n 1 isoform X2 [Drosophila rhopaloa]|uniref:Venom allergen 5 isoform X2 n=1 Tax=Drosophila rhopaloa TaxID=1041015 RepID=A0A6P4FLK6_DRORH|nr:antigen 5 like allergen Cul n 1 isoform X2 [Drosophila rhopaloa]